MPDHNALANENWPDSVRDESRRLRDNNGFVPSEELLIASITGERLTEDFAILASKAHFDPVNQAVIRALDFPEVMLDSKRGIEEQQKGEDTYTFTKEGLLDTPEKIRAYYMDLYPWVFPETGITLEGALKLTNFPEVLVASRCTSEKQLMKKTKMHGAMNSKDRPCKKRKKDTIRVPKIPEWIEGAG